MTDNEYQKIMTKLMLEHPFLNVCGAIPWKGHNNDSIKIEKDRMGLLDTKHKKAFEVCCEFFKNMEETPKTRHRNAPSSCELKHRLEEANKGIGHIYEGIFIAAGYYLGFRYSHSRSSQVNFWLEKEAYNTFIDKYGLNQDHKMR